MKTKMKMTSLITAVMFLSASCDSSETVSSKDIKPESVYEFYSLEFDGNKKIANVTAQLRLGSFHGATVRLDQNEKLTFDSQPFNHVDGDKVNAVADTVSWMLFSPIFLLFKTGTFYYSSVNSFAGNSHRIRFENAAYFLQVPTFELSSAESIVKQGGVEATFNYSANSNSTSEAIEKIGCQFKVEDANGTLLTVLSTEADILANGRAKCSKLFINETSTAEVKLKGKRLITEIRLQYEFLPQTSQRTNSQDQVRIWTSHIKELRSPIN